MWHAPIFVMFSNRILAISRVNWRMYLKNQENRVCEIKSVNRHSMISDGAVSS